MGSRSGPKYVEFVILVTSPLLWQQQFQNDNPWPIILDIRRCSDSLGYWVTSKGAPNCLSLAQELVSPRQSLRISGFDQRPAGRHRNPSASSAACAPWTAQVTQNGEGLEQQMRSSFGLHFLYLAGRTCCTTVATGRPLAD
jgi:hypothetical protein